MDTERVEQILEQVRELAIQYYEETGKPLGVAAEMAEFHAARQLRLRLANARSPGYDATRRRKRIQIKGRCLQPGKDRSPRMGVVSYKHPWDSLLLVLMDERFNATEMWELERERVRANFPPAKDTERTERGPSIGKFKRLAKLTWSA